MRFVWTLMFLFSSLIGAISAQNSSSQTFPLPKSHVWDQSATQVCTSAGQVAIRQAKDTAEASEYFRVESGHGEGRLEIKLKERDVSVSVGGEKPETYKIVSSTVGVIAAVLVGDVEPTLSSISIDKVTGYVILSTTKPRDFTRDIPLHIATMFVCSPAKP
jgi:hypothetical protein